ncbi:hypothetical protein OS493_015753 [Desmophyllum pertusum]|uniref:FERM domain-containing protein n=1 Tax=Desmophyllum pertusum TaxID=174260 RepID=A0A9W9YPK9_9CNID|nr:hypothetical protein OS493_015753 [Desmophyllum pertusum]
MSLHPSMYKVRNIAKRIKVQYEQFVNSEMTERNAKHNFIDYCQSMAGYGCHFYKLKECMGTISPKGGVVRCYFGVSPRKIIIMDEKTKAVVGTWQSKELKRWRSLADDTRLRVEFINKTFEFLLENKGVFKEVNDALLLCTKIELQILAGQDFSPWSKYAEETETWGAQALAAVAHKPALYADKYESDSGVVSRLRAISLASSVPDQYAAKIKRQLSISAKLSSSAPYQQGALQQKGDRGNIMALQTGVEAALPAAATSAISTGSPGNISVGSHTSEDLLLGSLQSTLGPSKCSWEPGSLTMTDQRRPSRGSETSVDESNSPTERHLLDPSGSSSSRRRKYTTESNTSSLGSDSPSSGQTTPTHKGPFCSTLRDDDDFESLRAILVKSSEEGCVKRVRRGVSRVVRCVKSSEEGCVKSSEEGCVKSSEEGCVKSSEEGCVKSSEEGCVKSSEEGCVKSSEEGCVKSSEEGCVKSSEEGCVKSSEEGCVKSSEEGCVKSSEEGCVKSSEEGCVKSSEEGCVKSSWEECG